ncbi:hypothetical protein BDR26DRAFT_900382 [Obelidium mucronatum]|nr:hypothetical protein BDR26DRAFT_900382 [Obelidium mucronatum]
MGLSGGLGLPLPCGQVSFALVFMSIGVRKKCVALKAGGGGGGGCAACAAPGCGGNCNFSTMTLLASNASNAYPNNHPNNPALSALNCVVHVFDTPLIDHKDHFAWDLEDVDLMPTIGNWMLVYQLCTNNGKNKPLFYSFNADNFLNWFFQQKPFFRLMRCAMAAFNADPPLPEIVAVNYYSRARKSVIHAMTEKPTHQLVVVGTKAMISGSINSMILNQ